MKEIINVSLYGGKSIFGGRETPLNADIIKCDKYKICSLFKDGKCRNIRMSSGYCRHGTVETVKGYTTRAKKYSEFKKKWSSHEKYNQLKHTFSSFDLIDGVISMRSTLFKTRRSQGDENSFEKCCNGICFATVWENRHNEKAYQDGLKIKVSELTTEIIKIIYNLKPKTLFENAEIKSYKEEFLRDLKLFLLDVIPETFEQFEKENGVFEMDFVGKKALLKTLNRGIVKISGSTNGVWNGKEIIVEDNVPIFLISKPIKSIKTIIVPEDDFEVEIIDNNQVNKNTVFT